MAIEEDYIMKRLKQVIDKLIETIFNLTTKEQKKNALDYYLTNSSRNYIFKLAQEGDIDTAENELFDLIYKHKDEDVNQENLKLALMFYEYLNNQDDEYLTTHDFSRDELQQGLKEVLSIYGYSSLATALLK